MENNHNTFEVGPSGEKSYYDPRTKYQLIQKLLGDHIANRRIELGISPQSASEESGIHLSIIDSIESGQETEIKNYIDYLSYLGGQVFIDWRDKDTPSDLRGMTAKMFKLK